MDVTQALASRHTVRAFLDKPVPRATVSAILEAALHAPSWANTQPWEIYVAGGETLERIREAYIDRTRRGLTAHPDIPFPGEWPDVCRERTRALTAGRAELLGVAPDDAQFRKDFLESNRRFFDAPTVAYLCLDRSLTSWSMLDLGMMAQSIMLAAQDHGVDSAIAVNLVCFADVIRTELDIPDEQSVVIGIALGYADTTNPSAGFRSSRRPFEDAVKLFDV